MELLHQAERVRLRNRGGDGKYLVAGDNELSVKLDRNGSLERAKWTVEFVTGSNYIRLKSCYNKYLTVCGEHVGHLTRGREVRQTSLSSGDSSVKWQPIEYGQHIKLKCQRGFLRGYTGLRYRNSIGHHISDETRRLSCQWIVEIAESHEDTTTQVPTRRQTTTEVCLLAPCVHGQASRTRERQRWLQLGVGAVTGAAGIGIGAVGLAQREQEAGDEEDLVMVDDDEDAEDGF